MVKNHKVASSIIDATWYKLKQLAAYKAEVVINVTSKNTSQICSKCGYIPEIKKDLSIRIHECLRYGLVIDRDHNAALNVLRLGLEQAHCIEGQPILISSNREVSKLPRRSTKPTNQFMGSSQGLM
jgi:transposase